MPSASGAACGMKAIHAGIALIFNYDKPMDTELAREMASLGRGLKWAGPGVGNGDSLYDMGMPPRMHGVSHVNAVKVTARTGACKADVNSLQITIYSEAIPALVPASELGWRLVDRLRLCQDLVIPRANLRHTAVLREEPRPQTGRVADKLPTGNSRLLTGASYAL